MWETACPESCLSGQKSKVNQTITSSLNSYVSYLGWGWSACFFSSIMRSNLPQKYSEAVNTTENKSTVISVIILHVFKANKMEPLARSENPNIVDALCWRTPPGIQRPNYSWWLENSWLIQEELYITCKGEEMERCSPSFSIQVTKILN